MSAKIRQLELDIKLFVLEGDLSDLHERLEVLCPAVDNSSVAYTQIYHAMGNELIQASRDITADQLIVDEAQGVSRDTFPSYYTGFLGPWVPNTFMSKAQEILKEETERWK